MADIAAVASRPRRKRLRDLGLPPSGTAETIFESFGTMIETSSLTSAQREWAEVRWRHEALRMFRESGTYRRRFVGLRTVATLSSLSVPVFAGLATVSGSHWEVATLVVGALGAAAVAGDQIFKFGARWRLYRTSFQT